MRVLVSLAIGAATVAVFGSGVVMLGLLVTVFLGGVVVALRALLTAPD